MPYEFLILCCRLSRSVKYLHRDSANENLNEEMMRVSVMWWKKK